MLASRLSDTVRDDASALASMLQSARFLLVQGRRGDVLTLGRRSLALVDAAAAKATPADLDTGRVIVLGTSTDGAAVCASLLPGDQAILPDDAPELWRWTPSMQLGLTLPRDKASMASHARSVLLWHRDNSFCPRCGSSTAAVRGGARRQCGSCAAEHYVRCDPVAIMLVLHPDRRQVLLARQPKFPRGMWSCIAGFIEPGETLEQSVRREALEETGLVVSSVTYHSSQPWAGPAAPQLMLACIAQAEEPAVITPDPAELEAARWFSLSELQQAHARCNDFRSTEPRTPPAMAIAHELIAAHLAAHSGSL